MARTLTLEGRMRPATHRRAVASAAPDPVVPDEMDIAGRSRRPYLAVLANEPVRQRIMRGRLKHRMHHNTRDFNESCALRRVLEEVVELRNAGATEAELRAFEAALRDLITDLYPGGELRTVDELDLVEHEIEARETGLALRARVTQRPEDYRAAAEAKRAEIAIETEAARVYDLTAARLERERMRTPGLRPVA